MTVGCGEIQTVLLFVGSEELVAAVMPFLLVSCLAYIRPLRWRRHVPPKHQLISNKLHDVISQK
jgi:hypothetical protein